MNKELIDSCKVKGLYTKGMSDEAMEEALTSPKKGNVSWQPKRLLDLHSARKDGKLDESFRYRWASREIGNVEKKLAEGWIICNKETDPDIFHDNPLRMDDGKPIDSTKTYRDLVVMKLPEELGKARDRFIRQRTENQTAGIKSRAEDNMQSIGPGAHVHGKITIE